MDIDNDNRSINAEPTDDRRARTMDALSVFIANQRSLLARTQSDIGRLKELQGELHDVVASHKSAADLVATLTQTLSGNGYRLSNALECALVEPDIEWQAFANTDPNILAQRLDNLQKKPKPAKQRLSPLQALVKSARKTVVDPVLRMYIARPPPIDPVDPNQVHNPYLYPDPLSDEEDATTTTKSTTKGDPAEVKRQQERAKIHELRRTKLEEQQYRGPHRTRGPGGAFVKNDDVDIDVIIDDDDNCMAVDGPIYATKSWPPADTFVPMARTKSARARRPSGRQMEINVGKGMTNECGVYDDFAVDDNTSEGSSTVTGTTSVLGKRARGKSKASADGAAVVSVSAPRRTRQGSQRAASYAASDTFSIDAGSPTPSIASTSKIPYNHVDPPPPVKPKGRGRPKGTTSSKPKAKSKIKSKAVVYDEEEEDDDGGGTDYAEGNGDGDGDAVVPKKVIYNKSRANRPKPATHKLAWSQSEQQLLDQLMIKIGDGEKNRWLKISEAMDGRRTPRQVASRVQKYLVKLKQYGVGI